MKNVYKIFTLFVVFLLANNTLFAQSGQELVDICGMVANQNGEATYLKDFQIKLEASKAGEEQQSDRYSLLLSKNTIYRFSICNSRDFPGEAILQLFDNNRLLGTNYMVATGNSYPTFDFRCTQTSVYHVFVNFREGKQGMSVVLLSFVERF
ncbi:MAG: hypothetical protein PF485_04915 [Bacteroidales bacterium]|jgi:hypothetical protein|nr:hypothetical protein [Bacteroidales bacterium]